MATVSKEMNTDEPVMDATLHERTVDGNLPALEVPSGVSLRRIHWQYMISFIAIHILALLVFVPWFFSWQGVIALFLGINIFGQLGIPIGYHRLLTHRSFKTPKWFERTLVTLALCNAQETPARWVAWHRRHHQHSDHREDPHSPLVNFLWAHAAWLVFEDRSTANYSFYQKYSRDILKDKYYMWLEKVGSPMAYFYFGHAVIYFFFAWAISIAVYGTGPVALQMATSVFVWGVLARTVWVWHITWAVNSLSHMFGYRNYETSDDSRNNWFVSLLTAGEGWHNNHHADPSSASVQHRWWEIDPNYYAIKCFELVGLAWDVVPPKHKRKNV